MNIPRTIISLGLAVVFAGSAAGSAHGASPAGKNLATGGNITVNAGELRAFVRRERSADVSKLPVAERRAELTKLVVRKALAEEGKRTGLLNDPEIATALLQWKARTYPDYYWKKVVDAKVKVSDDEVRALLNPRDTYWLGAILKDMSPEGEAEIRQVYETLRGGADFAETAMKHSQGLSASKGGDMGWTTLPSDRVPETESAVVRKTPVGGFTAPMATDVGWVIFQVREIRTAEQEFKEGQAEARAALRQKRIDIQRAIHLENLRQAATIMYAPEGSTKGPAAWVNGFAIFDAAPAAEATQHEKLSFSRITTKKIDLEKFIDAYLIVRATEEAGLDRDPELANGLELERMEVLFQIYLRRQAESGMSISEEDVRAEYRRYYVPDVFELQVVMSAKPALIAEALGRIKAGEDFGAVTERYSDHWMAKKKGMLGEGNIVDYPADMQKVIRGLPVNGVSDVLQLGNNYALVKVLSKRTVEVPPFEQVADQIRSRLVLRRRADLIEAFVGKRRAELKISIDEKQLEKL